MRESEHAATSSRSTGEEKSVLVRLVDGNAIVRRLRHLAFLAARPLTLGVRAAALDETGAVFLVRHTYLEGWYLPGGGVEPGETTQDSIRRELEEEGNIELSQAPRLVSIHLNRAGLKRDHVLFYACPHVRQTRPKTPDREIAESGFFALDDLPASVTPGTRRRLDELAGGGVADPFW